MIPGELDAFIHEKIMGECVHDWEEFVDLMNNKGRICRKCDFYVKLGYFLPIIPPYSTDIGMAMDKVIPKVTKNEIEWSIEFSKHGWFVTIDSPDAHTYTLSGNNPAKMICEHAKRVYEE